jgi:serine protease inhibitor
MRASSPLVSLALVVTLLSLTACDSLLGPRGEPGEIRLPRALSAQERSLIDAGNTFAFELLRQAPRERPDSPNVFLSPLSASMALGMTMNGTGGDTWSQMRDVLGFAGLDESQINRGYRDLIELLRGLDPKVEFGLANSVWAAQGIPFHDDFLERVRIWFDAHVQSLDFGDPGARDIMNDWVSDRTNGRIEELIDEIPPTAIMYLINAVYFNGDWVYRFDPNDTRSRTFTRADGATVQADMMSMQADLRFFFGDDAAVVELPYGGRAFTAIAALPAPGTTMAGLVDGLDAGVWADWMGRLDRAEPAAAAVILPKLELHYDRLMNGDLQALGMTDAFVPGLADFSRLTPLGGRGQDVFISRVQQQSFLKVDERGTEAAAATFVEIGRTSGGTPTFAFDRPFLLAIRERLSGTVLFIGIIGDPTA